ncbi:DUF4301 family protein [Winogradskyella aurantiaca]|uniref:DUF4301 family protein n=1 Tax=Winogradskyella aurantiaca TaxID=2219558 RepID=UPI000E1C4A03|nr:DUF4301 family protein [Winogradskyella aurantiaca]
MNLSDQDLKKIEEKGLTLKQVNKQIETFKTGLPYTHIVDTATIGNGITKLSDELIEETIDFFETHRKGLHLLKFVPASGAATRMFKFLFEFLKSYDPQVESINSYINKHELKDLSLFLVGLEKFPFYDLVIKQMSRDGSDYYAIESIRERVLTFVHAMLDEDKLDYGNFPKGLLPFHEYKNKVISTAFEEHLFETALYTSDDKVAHLHFTVSEKFRDKFVEETERIEHKVEKKTGLKFEIEYSFQMQSTDTIAVTPDNEPFREEDGSLLFRPSGHGALIKNLNELDADIIFIKNIDNVVMFMLKEEVAKYKKILAGILMKVQKEAFEFMHQLDADTLEEAELNSIAEFLTRRLNVKISHEFERYSDAYKREYLREKLNRPIRVCGMVKNEGEPGGGPFWVRDQNWNASLQIVESAQVNLNDPAQKNIFKNATHFNPVDLVCATKDYKGNKFDLNEFVDEKSAFITNKTRNGKAIKALELPGLWNGSMAFWNSIFVEVPIVTFNPVKTVNDLLKPPHQRGDIR